MTPEEREDALYESAMARIRRAQETGRNDVTLSKEELTAIQRRRERDARRKRREQRITIPLSELTAGLGGFSDEGPSRRSSGGSASRTSSGDRDRDESPFEYAYVNPDSMGSRHVSDPSASRTHLSRDVRSATVSPPSRNGSGLDPFQFMTGAPQGSLSRHESPAPRRRHDDSDSASDSSDDDGTPEPVRRQIEAAPASDERHRRDPERKASRDKSPPPSASKRLSTVAAPTRRKSVLLGSSVGVKSKRKGK